MKGCAPAGRLMLLPNQSSLVNPLNVAIVCIAARVKPQQDRDAHLSTSEFIDHRERERELYGANSIHFTRGRRRPPIEASHSSLLLFVRHAHRSMVCVWASTDADERAPPLPRAITAARCRLGTGAITYRGSANDDHNLSSARQVESEWDERPPATREERGGETHEAPPVRPRPRVGRGGPARLLFARHCFNGRSPGSRWVPRAPRCSSAVVLARSLASTPLR